MTCDVLFITFDSIWIVPNNEFINYAKIICDVGSENGENDDVKIISTHDEKVKIVGEILSNDSSRKILNLLNASNEMTINEIAQNTGLSMSLVTHHLKRMQSVQIVKVSKVGRSVKGHKMNYYSATNQSFLIVPSKEPVHSITSSLKKFSKFFAIGMAGIVSWMALRSSTYSIQESHSAGLRANTDLAVSDESDKWSSGSETGLDSDSSMVNYDDFADQVSEPEPMPNVEPEPSHSGVQDLTSQFTDADGRITGSISLDRTVYPEPYSATSADSPELLIVSIVIPILVVISGIILERILTRWYNKRKLKN